MEQDDDTSSLNIPSRAGCPPSETRHSTPKLSKPELEDIDKLVKATTKSEDVQTSRRLQRNVFVLAISFVFLFTAFGAMANLQSTLNKEGGLGSYSLALVYMMYALGSLFLPSLVIPKLGCKWTLIVSMVGYVAYIAVQFYPTFVTMIPAAALLGICAAPLWAAQSMYITKVGEKYALLNGEKTAAVLPRFFGLFFLAFQTAQVWGNLIVALLLEDDDDSGLDSNSGAAEREVRQCGAYHCPNIETSDVTKNLNNMTLGVAEMMDPIEEASKSTTTAINMGQVYILSTIFLATSVAAAIILIFFLDGLERFNVSSSKDQQTDEKRPSAYTRAIATVKNLQNSYQLLLIPMTLWTGFEMGFVSADFTVAYIACAWSLHQIGYLFICYGLCNSGSSYIFGRVINLVGRPPIFILGHCFHFGALVTMWSWTPSSETPITFYVVAGLWGLGDGIISTQINALNGLIFPDALEAAFSNRSLWNSLAGGIAYIVSNKLCMTTKLYTMLVLIISSVTCYLIVEFKLARQTKNTLNLEPTLAPSDPKGKTSNNKA